MTVFVRSGLGLQGQGTACNEIKYFKNIFKAVVERENKTKTTFNTYHSPEKTLGNVSVEAWTPEDFLE